MDGRYRIIGARTGVDDEMCSIVSTLSIYLKLAMETIDTPELGNMRELSVYDYFQKACTTYRNRGSTVRKVMVSLYSNELSPLTCGSPTMSIRHTHCTLLGRMLPTLMIEYVKIVDMSERKQ